MPGVRRCARRTRRSVSTQSFVEFAGYLPDHWVGTGFRVTPAVAFVNPAFELQIATAEVHDAFEVPLRLILDSRQPQGAPGAASATLTIEVCTTSRTASASSGARRPAC